VVAHASAVVSWENPRVQKVIWNIFTTVSETEPLLPVLFIASDNKSKASHIINIINQTIQLLQKLINTHGDLKFFFTSDSCDVRCTVIE